MQNIIFDMQCMVHQSALPCRCRERVRVQSELDYFTNHQHSAEQRHHVETENANFYLLR